MQQDIIDKLKSLKSIQPDEAWQIETKAMLMQKTSDFGLNEGIFKSREIRFAQPKSRWSALMPSRMAVSLTSLAVVLMSGVAAMGAAQSSLPGDTLYSVKKASEKVKLAVASDQDKPKIEIEQAGKRLEELAAVSRNASDAQQHRKVAELVTEFQAKVDSANTHLSQLSEKGRTDSKAQVASVAKVVNEQSEKYTDVLQQTTASLPAPVQEQVADKVADAATTANKTNISSLMVMVETDDEQNSEEITAKVQKTVEKAQARVDELTAQAGVAAQAQTACPMPEAQEDAPALESGCTAKDTADGNVVIAEEASKMLEEAKENLKNSNLTDTLKSVSQVTEITAQATTTPVIIATEAAPEGTNTAVPTDQ